MIDRHRSLIHTLMAGLVGLTLGLFIGWWVWPVQWIEAPGTTPAVSAPAQTGESPSVGNEGSGSNYSAIVDLVSQGLLYVAAVLLLAGGVVIGYQLLRQSQGKDPPEPPFPLPFNRNRSKQATAPREASASAPPLAGRPAKLRQPELNWLRKGSESEQQATSEEPVFREQPVAVPRPDEGSQRFHAVDSETSERGVESSEVDFPSSQQDEAPSREDTTGYLARDSITPKEHEGEHGPDNSVSFVAPETAMEAVQAGEDEPRGERFAEESIGDSSPLESAADKESDERGGVLPAAAVRTDSESEGLHVSPDSTDQELWEDSWHTLPSGATPSDVMNEPEEKSVASTEGHESYETPAGSDRPFEREERGTASSSLRGPDSYSVETEVTQSDTAPFARTTRQLVGQFEANYAFGIQTYDESFTINAADGELLGACGMGINESVDRAAADSDQVRLLDIWLYDRSAVSSVSQPLVSPGFDASGLDDYAESSGSDSSPPLEVVPGLTCALQSDRIELECTIKSASFLDGEQTPIPFRSVSVSLAVYVQS